MAVSSSTQAAVQSDAARCPICQGATSFSVENRYRPFCSARCQTIDLGNWLGERYVVPGAASEPDEDGDRVAASSAESDGADA
jgi:uncharacterized protein